MKLGVLMDPIHTLNPQHDSTIAMLLTAAKRGWEIYYFTATALFAQNGNTYSLATKLTVNNNSFSLGKNSTIALNNFSLILMRKDPPFDIPYLYLTHLLAQTKTLVVNKPHTLATANEKITSTLFPACCPPTIITSNIALLTDFWQQEQDIVCKPMHAMGGTGVCRIKPQDPNAQVIFTMLTHQETCHIMAQRFIPEINSGDKRIILIGGIPIPFALQRIPAIGDWRGNMAVGATAIAQPLTAHDRWICQQISPYLQNNGIYFAGIDVIGNYLTEINITSPTGIRELDQQCGINISKILFDYLEPLIT
jgi:glutathione synthase